MNDKPTAGDKRNNRQCIYCGKNVYDTFTDSDGWTEDPHHIPDCLLEFNRRIVELEEKNNPRD